MQMHKYCNKPKTQQKKYTWEKETGCFNTAAKPAALTENMLNLATHKMKKWNFLKVKDY